METSAWIPHIVGIAGPIVFPIAALAMALVWWEEYNRTVDRETCGCSCWDTAFKGSNTADFAGSFSC